MVSRSLKADIVLEWKAKLIPIEVKLLATPNLAMVVGIESFRNDIGQESTKRYFVYSSEDTLPLGAGVTAIPYSVF